MEVNAGRGVTPMCFQWGLPTLQRCGFSLPALFQGGRGVLTSSIAALGAAALSSARTERSSPKGSFC